MKTQSNSHTKVKRNGKNEQKSTKKFQMGKTNEVVQQPNPLIRNIEKTKKNKTMTNLNLNYGNDSLTNVELYNNNRRCVETTIKRETANE